MILKYKIKETDTYRIIKEVLKSYFQISDRLLLKLKRNEKICKKFLAFPGTKCYTIKRTFARGLFSNPQKENAFQKFTTENSPTRGARSKERRIHHEG